MAKIETVRKITLGACGAQPDLEQIAKLQKSGGTQPLLDVYGVATKYKPGQSNFGEYIAFLGQFRAVRHADKQAFESGKILLPKMLEESLWGVMGTEVSNVQFAFRIGVKYDKKSATQYSYTAESLLPPSESDPVAMLEKQLSGKLLSAPRA
jgi:hypothetical protein